MKTRFLNDIKNHLPFELVQMIENQLSMSQRDTINWYLLEMAIKAKKNNSVVDMRKFISNWHNEEVKKFGIKSIYHESR